MASDRLSEPGSAGRERIPADRRISDASITEDAFDALDAAQVRSALLRGAARPGAPADDIDLLVHPADIERVDSALSTLGFVRIPAWGHGSHRFHLRFAPATGWTKLDIVDRLAFGPSQALETELESDVLARRVRRGRSWHLHPADAAWALLLHLAIDAPGVRPDRRADQLRSIADHLREDSPIARFVRGLDDGSLRERLIAEASAGDYARIQAAAAPLARAWRNVDARRHDAVSLRGTAARKAGRLLVPVRRPGITVALLGPDGSGKSTAAHELQRTMPLDVRSVYMGMYARPTSDRRGLSFALRVARLWRWAIVARWHAMRGRIVIFDRYSYDALLPATSRRGRLSRLRRWVLARSLPSPDLTLLLDAPPERLAERKSEQSTDELARQRAGYLTLRERVPRLVVVDASRPMREVHDEISDHVWRGLRRRLARTAR